ncbi:MAG TPA: hypothetical protein VJK03_02635 [Candidatus Nanoarchaeia archaeon]|nr:hypothetical protein [Candidatus Nanoarchaeia archaeon]
MQKRVIVACIVAAGVIALLIFLNAREEAEVKNNKTAVLHPCLADNDCVRVQTGCCSCSMGGKEICVSSSEKPEYEEKVRECGRVFCTAVYACTTEACRCVEGTCR